MPGWNNCSCSTVYTDAWGNPINGPGSGADGSTVTQSCAPNWGFIAIAVLAAVVAVHVAK